MELDGGRRGAGADSYCAAGLDDRSGIMELQRTSSISGPLSPAYTGQVPYNYNQLEGRFKQLQGKSSLPKAGLLGGGVFRRDPGAFGSFISAIWL